MTTPCAMPWCANAAAKESRLCERDDAYRVAARETMAARYLAADPTKTRADFPDDLFDEDAWIERVSERTYFAHDALEQTSVPTEHFPDGVVPPTVAIEAGFHPNTFAQCALPRPPGLLLAVHPWLYQQPSELHRPIQQMIGLYVAHHRIPVWGLIWQRWWLFVTTGPAEYTATADAFWICEPTEDGAEWTLLGAS